ncbi:MAG: glycoside hydrolase family 3 C-terminal domain-containing protein, partial [Spirochaetales bacterium]|nr:glycoside hydrolase family 3 C-terminal domain-containing protein [Spirochaetales bacterium]
MMTIVKGPTNNEPTRVELENRQLSRKAAREGFVLLENNGVLPLKAKKIALYGSGARMTVKGGRGSGEVRNRYSVSIEQGLEGAGFEILTKGWLDGFDKFYADTYEAYRVEMEKRVEGLRDFHEIQRAMYPFEVPTGMPVTTADIVDVDTAIYVIARQAGEGHDRTPEKGDFQLSDIERENLEFVASHYRNMVVVINVGGLIDLSIVDELKPAAIVYYVQGGEEGGNALADLLSGEYNFSGKLTTSWPRSFSEVPSSRNYSGASDDKFTQDYNEGIFVGYRYYDTFGVRPRFAFGHGLSYTSFRIQSNGAGLSADGIAMSAEVRNTGSRKGREVVQLYASVPFGCGEEKQRLVAFGKTADLKPGEAETVNLCFTFKDIAVYDEASASWILRAGNYVLRLGNASDCTRPVAVLTLEADHVLERCTNICPLKKELAQLQAPDRQIEDLGGVAVCKMDGYVPETVVHTYERPEEEIDPLVKRMTDEQIVELVVGPSVAATGLQVQALGSSGNTTGKLYDELGIPNVVLSDGPAGLNLSAWVVQLPNGEVRGALIPENIEAYKRYLFGFNRIAMLSRMAKPEDGTMHYQYATAWPCSQLLAQSFDTGL